MANIGFSTGCLYRSGMSMEEIIRFYKDLGTDTIEISLATPQDLSELRLTDGFVDTINRFDHVTIHAPWKNVEYCGSNDAVMALSILKSLCAKIDVEGVVMHPDTIDSFHLLEYTRMPILLENMDHRKKFGTHPEHFERLKERCSFGFVLDLQHAYEHDPSMILADELIDVMGDRLKEIHVSGCKGDEYHFPTYSADNQKEIRRILQYRLPVTKILEGRIEDNFERTAHTEIEYVKEIEKKIK